MNDFASDYAIVEIGKLKEHEEINKNRLEQLKNEIISDEILKNPIVVDKKTNVILDGHHRFNALKELDYEKIPVIFVDYQSPKIQVRAWRNGEKITKDLVISTALAGERLPPKTSKHMIVANGSLEHISKIEEKINIPLEELK